MSEDLARCSRYVAQVKRDQAVSSSSGEEEVWDVTGKSIEEIRGFLMRWEKDFRVRNSSGCSWEVEEVDEET